MTQVKQETLLHFIFETVLCVAFTFPPLSNIAELKEVAHE
jgi:hypothetical protein